MPQYRLYTLTQDGHVAAPPAIIDWPNDDEAIRNVIQAVDGGNYVELREGERFIIRVAGGNGLNRAPLALSLAASKSSPRTN
jgi:hypothetical protein